MNDLKKIYLGDIIKEKGYSKFGKEYKYYEVIDNALLCYIEENNHKYALVLSGVLIGEKLDLKNEYFVVNDKSLFELSRYQKTFDLNSLINAYKLHIGDFYNRSSLTNSFILIRDASRILEIINNIDTKEDKIISLSKYKKYLRH